MGLITKYLLFREWKALITNQPYNEFSIEHLNRFTLNEFVNVEISVMLKSCFFRDISPALAEESLIKQNSYLVRQCDRDPGQLILTYQNASGPRHVIIPDFGTEEHSRRLIVDRLEEASDKVEHFLSNFGCQHPVIPTFPISPVPQWKKRGPEVTDGQTRCSICPAFGDKKKIVNHPFTHHKIQCCFKCEKYVMCSLCIIYNMNFFIFLYKTSILIIKHEFL